ncbi:MAG: molybdopterin-dependent oxidoreductase [Deltaproteobacteria bacterium]|nr:molybdopterin-dependent oxidoreductase [Deltaproteobacteria bacterium]
MTQPAAPTSAPARRPQRVLTLQVNGEPVEVAAPSTWTLLEVLRYKLGLTGTKQGCDKGDCGACTVLVDGQPVLSCCTLAATVGDKAVTTIEGLPIRVGRAFDIAGALQCGFCQPGMICSAHALLSHKPDPSVSEIRAALSGNLCRCTGYTKIIEAVQLAAKDLGGHADLSTSELRTPVAYGPPAEGFLVLGARGRKADSIHKATGAAIYADDISLPRMAHGRILRSPHPHARIRRIDTRAAAALPGVFAVMTGAELPETFCVIPWTPDENVLCIDKVRYVGDGVAAVAAIDEETAIRACDLIEVDYEILPPVLDLDAAEAATALVHERDWKGRPRVDNLCKDVDLAFGEVEPALEGAAVTHGATYFYEGNTHAAIEPHCAVARWSPDGKLTVWSSTQVPHYLHRELGKVLGVPTSEIRVIQPALGGAFGGKSEPFDLEFCAAWLSRKAGRPVKILYTREEVFYSHRGRHPMEMKLRMGAAADGRLLAVDNDIRIDGGGYHSFGMITSYYAGQILTGPVRMDHYHFRARRFYTNKPCCGPKRGHGSVQPRFAFECGLDELAEKLGMDPMDIRRKNAMGSGERTVNGQLVPSTGLAACLDAVEKASGWKGRWGQQPRGRGLGVACSMYISGTAYPIYPNEMPQSGVQLLADRSGRITVLCGASDIGQGSDGMLAYVVAEETGILPDDVAVHSADTELTPVDLGAYSSRVTYMVGTAAQEAARAMGAEMRAALAAHWEIPADQVGKSLGFWFDKAESGRQMDTKAVLQLAEARAGTPLAASGGYRTRKVGGAYRGGTIGASPAYSTTAHVVEVEVDVETGIVKVLNVWVAHDCGRAINPVLVEGQVEGSVYMGYAEALMEAQTFDERGLHSGPNLLDYRIPTSIETPAIFTKIIETIDPGGPYGAKEAGEGPLHPIIPAIANAIWDAVGVRLRTLPFTPDRVLAAIRAQGAAAAPA